MVIGVPTLSPSRLCTALLAPLAVLMKFVACLVCVLCLTGDSFAFRVGLQHRTWRLLSNRLARPCLSPLFAALNGTSASYEYVRDTESRLRNDQEKSYIALQRSIDGLTEYIKTELKELKTELKADMEKLKTELKSDMEKIKTELKEVKTELKADVKELDTKFMKAAWGFFLALTTVGLSSQPDLREWALSFFAAFK